jgi:hypothetical protein
MNSALFFPPSDSAQAAAASRSAMTCASGTLATISFRIASTLALRIGSPCRA